jgi:hypothetical protein
MSNPTAPDRQAGVLISGAFGTGKSSTAEVDGDRPVGEVASDILCLLRW